MYTIVGDVHGKFSEFNKIVKNSKNKVIQVGDLGVGFRDINQLEKGFYFIHGNHDNPKECKTMSQFLGRFGVFDGIFFVSGAESIDRQWRMENVNWWRPEELSYSEGLEVMKLYVDTKPEIVISHDCPLSVYPKLMSHHSIQVSRTAQLLNAMLDTHQPKLWIFWTSSQVY